MLVIVPREMDLGGISYRSPDNGDMALNPGLVAFAEERDAAHNGSGQELDAEDGVDLADELVADIDGGLGDGASKLQAVHVSYLCHDGVTSVLHHQRNFALP